MNTYDDPLPYLDKTFLQHLSSYAFMQYLKEGYGYCVIKESTEVIEEDNIEDLLEYIPYEINSDKVPLEAIDMIQNYDPQKELILVVRNNSQEMLAIQLTVQQLGSTPKEAYRTLIRQNRMGALIPGEVVSLKETVQDIQPGHYIFLTRDGAFMEFCKAGIDDDEDEIVRTDKTVKCHIDFEECFRIMMQDLIT